MTSHYLKPIMRNLFLAFAAIAVSSWQTATAGGWEHWKEEALLHDGRIVVVDRKLYFEFKLLCGDSGSPRSFCNLPKTYVVSFKHPDTREEVTWEGDHFLPAALEIVNQTPYLVVLGPGAPVAMGIYPACEGTPYIYYRFDMASHKWSLLKEAEIPKELATANLGFGYEKEDKGKLLSAQMILSHNNRTERRTSSWLNVKLPKSFHEWTFYGKWDFAASQRRMYKGPDGCKDIKPLPDPEMEASKQQIQQLFDTAELGSGKLITIDAVPETFTKREYKDIEGRWTGSAWIKQGCKGVIKSIETPENLSGRYAQQINFENGRRAQVDYKKGFWLFACSGGIVFAFKHEKEKGNLTIARYLDTGEAIDATKVVLEENTMPPAEEKEGLLRVLFNSNDDLILEFAQEVGYKTNLPPPAYRMVVRKAKYNVKLKPLKKP